MMFEQSAQVTDKLHQPTEEMADSAFQISAELIDTLLDKLSSDDEFRAVFQRSPRIALAYLGHDEASEASEADWAHLRCETLASPETIRLSRSVIKMDLLTSHARLIPIMLDSPKKS